MFYVGHKLKVICYLFIESLGPTTPNTEKHHSHDVRSCESRNLCITFFTRPPLDKRRWCSLFVCSSVLVKVSCFRTRKVLILSRRKCIHYFPSIQPTWTSLMSHHDLSRKCCFWKEVDAICLAINLKLCKISYQAKLFVIVFERAFKMMKNDIYFIVTALLVAEFFKNLIYAN